MSTLMYQCVKAITILNPIKTDRTIVDTIRLFRVLVQNEINSALILLLRSEDTELSLLVAASRATRDCCCNSLAALVACDIRCSSIQFQNLVSCFLRAICENIGNIFRKTNRRLFCFFQRSIYPCIYI